MRLSYVALFFALSGCGGSDGDDADAGGDVGQDGACATNTDCDDEMYCNGAEQCAPEDDEADSRGCVAGTAPCPGTMCNETERECETDCRDSDGDGHDDVACGGDDCDDDDAEAYPGATEICDEARDEDCDATSLGSDDDEDGFESDECCNGSACGADCDDGDPSRNPGAVDACNGVDDDCDGDIDENPTLTFYRDVDGDGAGVDADTLQACAAPPGFAVVGGDCDDSNRNVNPSAPEACNGRDDNCTMGTDEGCDCTPEGASQMCGDTSEGECSFGSQTCVAGVWSECAGAILARPEECDALARDEDCDGDANEGCTCTAGETRVCGVTDDGACRTVTQTCAAGAWPRDCGAEAMVVLPQPESCDGVDTDCDGESDDADPDVMGIGDACSTNVGECTLGTYSCNGTTLVCSGVAAMTEACDHDDDDCDGQLDNGAGAATCSLGASTTLPDVFECYPTACDLIDRDEEDLRLVDENTGGSPSPPRAVWLGTSASGNTFDWGRELSVSGTFERTNNTNAWFGVAISPNRGVGSVAQQGIPPNAGTVVGFAAVIAANDDLVIYEMVGSTAVQRAMLQMSPACVSPATKTVTLLAIGGNLTARVQAGAACNQSVSYNDTDWQALVYGLGPTFPRYSFGAVGRNDASPVAGGRLYLTSFSVTRTQSTTQGNCIPCRP